MKEKITHKEIARLRLSNQRIAGSAMHSPEQVVRYMGAIQAQDYAMSRWAVGTRLPDSMETSIEAAIDRGKIIRMHVLRPTWHLVAATDVYWMLDLTASRIRASSRTMQKSLELTEAIFSKSNALIKKALSDGKHITREELKAVFKKARIAVNENRLSHLMLRAELDGLVCSGASINNKQTYALLTLRVPERKTLSKDEALKKLAQKYFTARGPATLGDFCWWSGLSATDAGDALEMLMPKLQHAKLDGQNYWFDDAETNNKLNAQVHLLPAYDEFIISYKDRASSLADAHHTKMISNNGIFRPMIVVGGQVAGVWKREIKNQKLYVHTTLFQPQSPATKRKIEEAIKDFARFTGKEPMAEKR